MKLISPTEQQFIRLSVQQNLRIDGRKRTEWRPVTIVTNCLPQATGSARLQIQGTTDILVGITVDLSTPLASSPDKGKVLCTVECSPTTRIDEVEGISFTEVNVDCAEFLSRLLTSSLPLEQLCIKKGIHCWIICVDVLVLEFNGNLLDAVVMAVSAALSTTTIPTATVISEESIGENEEEEKSQSNAMNIDEVSTNENQGKSSYSSRIASQIEINNDICFPLDISSFPLTTTLTEISTPIAAAYDKGNESGNLFVCDASISEELSAQTKLHMAFDHSGRIYGLKMNGAGRLKPTALLEAIRQAKHQSVAQFKIFNEALSPNNSSMIEKIAF